ncbi:di-heme-cytochrome C peroxidase [Nitrosomonas sp. Is24]|uniref:di-heme-cytochrome C peroxidase n=1 Tax=Nitrosomonas sp. Is24 TaxID=3080533 RepID=UPI00294AEC96|nr:di-heme-cytochrome C peroxidase [Nitrosomonas sp. Is24]MDV6340628.1 di-heme-cytochrome C peroxidase [Nitrosomonas sp. Is24]
MKQYFISSEKRSLFSYVASMLSIGILSACTLIPGNEPDDRHAVTVEKDHLGDSYTKVQYLDQGWNSVDSLWFYYTTQGSNLMPYDFFLALEKPGQSQLFRSDENMNFYRYLPQKASSANPDALPVGWVKDKYKGKEYVGLTCAACHTGQINYNGVGIRIDGGPASADMENIMIDLAKALKHTREDAEAKQRFVKNVLARGNYKSEADVLADLSKYEQRIYSYTYINASQTSYGYARLDAFGRIYNRVLEHTINARELREILSDRKIMDDKVMTKEQIDEILAKIDNVITGEQRDHLMERLSKYLTFEQIALLNNEIFNRPDAPVSYPFLWDIAQHDFVQWNGIADNAGLGPIGRNTGEVIGVFGTLDWKEEKGTSLTSILFQGSGNTRVKFDSSVDVQNLHRIESHLKKLNSPVWPQEILGKINEEQAAKGKLLFDEYCAACHARIDRDDPNRRVVAHMTKVSAIGTDSTMAENSFKYQGYSGILRNQYVGLEVGNILLDKEAPVAALLTQATKNVVATPDPDKWFFQRWTDWAANLVTAYAENEIKSSIKNGNYDPDTTVNPLASLNAYKGRPLNGIWATAPYLHNGSVPSLYDLLLPKKREGDPEDGEYRPDQFEVGSREFDPVKVGLKSSGYKSFTFDTSFPGNSNAGHEYASGKTAQPNGVTLRPLNKDEKLDVLEYLKTL